MDQTRLRDKGSSSSYTILLGMLFPSTRVIDFYSTNTITRAEFRFLSCHFPPSVLKALVAQCAKLKVSGADGMLFFSLSLSIEWLKRNITIDIVWFLRRS